MKRPETEKLEKTLSLIDVYAISTGAMFSSGFFLLPGLASALTGPSVVLAYLISGLLVLPALFSLAEMCTAMPRAGGAYYFLDRSLGPALGTVGGLGTWVAQVFKSAFALVGIGAYLTLLTDIPMQGLMVSLTVGFVALNVVGAKESTRLQQALVLILITVVSAFVLLGLVRFMAEGPVETARRQFVPFLSFGVEGMASTVGLVFVSYAGLTKVAGIAEEVEDADRNIPLGMILSLLTATLLYVLGVFVMVAVLDPVEFRGDLVPAASATTALLDGSAGLVALILVVAAAMAAFASTANAGVMSASRYLLAMARDRLVWEGFARLGRFRTPTRSLVLTGSIIVFCLLAFDVEAVAKLASAFLLLVFTLVNLALVVMRESGIRGYHPGFRSPLYPWMQIAGIVVPIWLIVEMGSMTVVFTTGVAAAGFVWYLVYGRSRTVRDGAVYHVFERLGRRRYDGLDREMLQIFKEKGLRTGGIFEEMVSRSVVLDLAEPKEFGAVAEVVGGILARRTGVDADELSREFMEVARKGGAAFFDGAGVPHATVAGVEDPELVLVRSTDGIDVTGWVNSGYISSGNETDVHALCFLVSTSDDPGLHVRVLAELVTRLGEEGFIQAWLEAEDPSGLRELLVRDDSYLVRTLDSEGVGGEFIGRTLRELDLPPGSLVGAVRRGHRIIVPTGATVLQEGDRVTVMGEPEVIKRVRSRFDGAGEE